MSKQKIKEWLGSKHENYSNKLKNIISESIHQYTQDQSGWVSVEDRLPETNKLILICTNNFDEETRYSCGAFDGSNWWHKNEYCASWTPTHWVPLPLPPTEEA